QVDGEPQQVGPVRQWRESPGEDQGEEELVRGLSVVGQVGHDIFEAQQDPGVDFQGQVEIEGTVAPLFRVEVDLPRLAERVGLDEVALVVHVEAVIHGVILELGDVAGDVDDSHGRPGYPRLLSYLSSLTSAPVWLP